MAANVS